MPSTFAILIDVEPARRSSVFVRDQALGELDLVLVHAGSCARSVFARRAHP